MENRKKGELILMGYVHNKSEQLSHQNFSLKFWSLTKKCYRKKEAMKKNI